MGMGKLLRQFLERIRALICRAICGGQQADVCNNSDGALTDKSFIIVSTPTSGMRVQSGFTAKGCSRTFESNVPWRLVDRDGNQLATGATTGGGVDGFGPFSFTVSFNVVTQQIGHLEVIEDDPSDGEGFPPVRNVIPLVLNP
jgi:hypothetical protein